MLTGNESEQQRIFAEFLGVDAYINKPVGIKPLLAQLGMFCPKPSPFISGDTLVAGRTTSFTGL
jgi:DNA-binding response OmpR family regulator